MTDYAAQGDPGRNRNFSRRLLSYLNHADAAEALAYGFGIPPEIALTEVRCLWWRLRRQGHRLPAERRQRSRPRN